MIRALEAEEDWPFFEPDCALSQSRRSLIRPLSQQGASAFWEAHISSDRLARHPMLLPRHHWLASGIQEPDRLRDISRNAPAAPMHASVTALLVEEFGLNNEEEVFFVLMKERIYATEFGLFSAYWEQFLMLGDEGPFLFHPPTGRYAQFSPHGRLSFGTRAG